MSNAEQRHFEYWQRFEKLMRNRESIVQPFTPLKDTCVGYVLKKRFILAAYTALSPKKTRCGIIIHPPDAKNAFDYLFENHRRKIEEEYGSALNWKRLDEGDECQILKNREVDSTILGDEKAQFDWLAENLETFQRVFTPYIEEIEGGQVNLSRGEFQRNSTNSNVATTAELLEKELAELNERYAGTPEYKQRIVNQVNRPSQLRDKILELRGTDCQICKGEGFAKKNGGRYAETHHMIELSEKAPQTLQSWNVLVLCPTCHRKLHYADVDVEYLGNSWRIQINGEFYEIR